MRRARRLGIGVVLVPVAAAALLAGWSAMREQGLDLGDPPGALTGRRLAGLASHPGFCRALLVRAGVRYERVAPRRDGPNCGWAVALRLAPGGTRTIALLPEEPPLACPVAAGLMMWEWSVVQPAARRRLGAAVTGIEHLGTYNCRRIADSASWSQHATANAVDVSAFTLADGRRIAVLDDWHRRGPEAAFLREVRTGACALFATVLSPDYNTAHRDHLHLDQAPRGQWGPRSCR